ncbi:hypothetical protein OOT46_20125 [Aquabacterium sp. A7-Y]|uniref:hypothetical protein n=1 Tax=Aquabacterium sp. A7-Y TaxID=1349605 RepID=UPI00223DF796|nr:hypothetical protein [Aquabacterium sp. A7-Y]MCW7540145.1 hypothetical protein [Aquabacterium sp. A7-Y]
MKVKAAALILLSCMAASAFSADMPIAKLYKSYEKSGRSSDQMPEYNKVVEVSGIVMGKTVSLSGETLVSVGTRGSEAELARASFSEATKAEKLAALKEGAAFKASCSVGFTMNSDFLPLQGCVLK